LLWKAFVDGSSVLAATSCVALSGSPDVLHAAASVATNTPKAHLIVIIMV
jgi:hypothetical protein